MMLTTISDKNIERLMAHFDDRREGLQKIVEEAIDINASAVYLWPRLFASVLHVVESF